MSETTGSEFTYQFYGRRGITAESFRHFDCQTKIDREGKPLSVGYKYPNGSIKVRTLAQKSFHWVGSPQAGLYGSNLYGSGSNKSVTIVEGEEDAHSLWQVLHTPVVSVQSSATARRDCVADAAWLSGFDRIVICFDSDAQGREALRSVAQLFDYNKVFVVRLNKKDANEYLQAGLDNELLNMWHNARKYVPEQIICTFAEFEEALAQETSIGIPWPWPALTEMTGGIRTHEFVLVTAQEGVGKTEWMKAVEHHLLKETDANVAAIYIEEPKDRHLKSLVGIETGAPVHLPEYSISLAEQSSALRRLCKRDGRLHLYNHFGTIDPDIMLDHIRFLVVACSCGYVLLDHITMVVAGMAGEEDERRALDYFCTRLEMMTKELGFSLIGVSHVNDNGQTRGSRLISKLADMRIDLSRDIRSSDLTTQRTLTQIISKPSRFTGKSGPVNSLLFDPETRKFTELTGANDNGRHHNQAFPDAA